MIVPDASLLTMALTDDGPGGSAAQGALLADSHWIAPDHLSVEVTSAIRGRWLGGRISGERADGALQTLLALTVTYVAFAELGQRVWELRHNVTPYDAAYLAVAEMNGCRLVTIDRKLRDCAGGHCTVEVIAGSC